MIPQRSQGSESSEDDVRYRIAACRKRLRSGRATQRTQNQSQSDDSIGENRPSGGRVVESYAEILARVSMSQSSISRLIECLLEPAESNKLVSEELEEQEEAAIT
jgi:hypothetical protein